MLPAAAAAETVDRVKPIRSICLCLSLFALLSGCRKETPTDSAQDSVPLDYAEFAFTLPDGGRGRLVSAVHDSLMASYERVTRHLEVPVMPKLTVSIWATSTAFYGAMERHLGQVYPGATGYLNGPRELCILFRPEAPGESVHEFAHAVSLALNPSFSNNPRWFWEAVAVYEAREVTDATRWPNEEKRFPGFAALNQFNSPLPYRWGYPISSFIISQWGDSGYVDLIRSNGSIQALFGVTESQFGTMIERYIGRQ